MKINSFSKIPYIGEIQAFAKKRKINIWLVGGFLRDIHLKAKKDLIDFDFCVEKNTPAVVRAVNKTIQGKIILLEEGLPSFRIALNRNGNIYTYDFSGLRGSNIKEDLSLRDFTINTLALCLNKPVKVLDYYQGLKDLEKKKIKALSEAVLVDDPLRILRGFSFSAQYGFKIEAKTLRFFKKHKDKIAKASSERINEEFFKVFSCHSSYKIIKKMDKFEVINQIIPNTELMRKTGQGRYHHLDVWNHSIETLRQFELLYNRRIKKRELIDAYLNQQLARGRKRIHILKVACLLHDVGKPLVEKKAKGRTIFHTHEKAGRDFCGQFAKKLRLSNKERQSLEKMVFWHLRPGYLADQVTPSSRAVYRFFRDTGEEGASIILLSLADWRATRGPLTDPVKRKQHEKIMLKLLESYFEKSKKKPLPKIIDGYDIMRYFDVGSGPQVGKVLGKIKELQALGKVKNKSEALQAAKKIIKK